MQELMKVNTTQAWFGRSGYLEGSNLGFRGYTSKRQTKYTGSWVGSKMAWKRDF